MVAEDNKGENKMTTKQEPLISRQDIESIHKGNEINRRVLQSGIRLLVSEVHRGNEQSAELVKGVRQLNG